MKQKQRHPSSPEEALQFSIEKQLRRAEMDILDRKARRAQLRISTGCPSRVVRGFQKETKILF